MQLVVDLAPCHEPASSSHDQLGYLGPVVMTFLHSILSLVICTTSLKFLSHHFRMFSIHLHDGLPRWLSHSSIPNNSVLQKSILSHRSFCSDLAILHDLYTTESWGLQQKTMKIISELELIESWCGYQLWSVVELLKMNSGEGGVRIEAPTASKRVRYSPLHSPSPKFFYHFGHEIMQFRRYLQALLSLSLHKVINQSSINYQQKWVRLQKT